MKTYKGIRHIQHYTKRHCIEQAKKHCTDDLFEVTATKLELSKITGHVYFTLSIQAKDRKTLLILCDKAWTVRIGRQGAVHSSKIEFTPPFKTKALSRNKYCIFI